MFYIVEEENKLAHLEQYSKCYVDVVSSNDNYHPFLTSTIAVYVHILDIQESFIIPVAHPEGINIDKERIYQLLSNFSTLYTTNKKSLLYHFNLQDAIDLSMVHSMSKYERLEYSYDAGNTNHFYSKFGHTEFKSINKLIPISRLFESRNKVFNQIKHTLDLDIPDGFSFYNNLGTNVFFLLEQQGLGINYQEYKSLFTPRNILYNTEDNKVLTFYNLYNATSRPTNAFNSVNYAAIPKSDEHRKCFRPTKDYFVEFDFDGYHLRLLAEQIDYELTPDSAHKQLAKHYFGTEDISEEQYKQAKQINFQAIYGKIPEEHKDLDIFVKIQEYIDSMWSSYIETGCVWNPQSGKQFNSNLKDMNPAKLMNYMMQSLETSRNILILKEVLRYLKDKSTKPVLFTYDAILFDYDKSDGKDTLEGIQEILEQKGKFPVKFKFSKDLVL